MSTVLAGDVAQTLERALPLLQIEREAVPDRVLAAIADPRQRLERWLGAVGTAVCKLFRKAEPWFPSAVWLRRAAWKLNAWYAAMAAASAVDHILVLDDVRSRQAAKLRAMTEAAIREMSPGMRALMEMGGAEAMLIVFGSSNAADAQMSTLALAAQQAVVLCIACDDYATDHDPPSLAGNKMDDAYNRAYLHFTLMGNPVPSVITRGLPAHGAKERHSE